MIETIKELFGSYIFRLAVIAGTILIPVLFLLSKISTVV